MAMSKQKLKLLVMVITVIRIPLVLGFAICTLVAFLAEVPAWNILGFVLLVLSAVSDLFDGLLARKYEVTSRLGAYADPLADKIFYLIALPTLLFLAMLEGQTVHGVMLLTLTILFLLRDQWVSFLRSIGSEHHADVRANWSGKLRTAISFPIICIVFVFMAWFPDVPLAVLYVIESVGILINLISVWVYTAQYLPYLKASYDSE